MFSCCGVAGAQQAPLARQVNVAINRGLRQLERTQKQNGSWESRFSKQYPGGVESLVVLAALEAGRDIDDRLVKRTLRYIDRINPTTVYVRSVRAMVYAHLGDEYIELLAADIGWLLDNQKDNGGWGYGAMHPTTRARSGWTDSSNTQMAVLAIKQATDAGVKVPRQIWSKCEKFWRLSQNRDGGWGYEPSGGNPHDRLKGSSYGAMTAAGVASLFIVTDKESGRQKQLTADAINDGLKWLIANYTVEKVPGWVWGTSEDWLHYYLFNLARVADRAGMRKFDGNHIWADMVKVLLKRQGERGLWSGSTSGKEEPMQTSLAILCLCRANRPVMINRTAFHRETPYRDAADIVKWATNELSEPMAWQAVQPNDNAEVFNEAPILMISWEAHSSRLMSIHVREFLRNGGTVLVVADKRPSRQRAIDYFVSLTGYSKHTLGDDHPVFNLEFKIRPNNRPDCLAAGDGIRTRVFVVDKAFVDGPARGRKRASPANPAFAFVTNIFLYTTDMQMPRGRLASRRPTVAAVKPKRQLALCRIAHKGDWNVSPKAFDRLSETLTAAVSIGVKEQLAVKLDGPVIRQPLVLWMTGTKSPRLQIQQLQHLKDYIRGGGTLFIDPAVGSEEFYNAAVTAVEKMFGSGAVKAIDLDHEFITGSFGGGIGIDITYVDYSRSLKAKNIPAGPHLSGVFLDGRLAVIISRYGVTCPMEGQATFGCLGLSTPDARRIAANVVLYAASGK